MKKTILLIALILFSSFVFADSITNYTIKQEVPLEKILTVTGTFNADVNANVLCKFLIVEQDGETLFRLTDEYTFSDGTFYTEKIIFEPQFRRGQDYNVTTTCGSVSATAKFSVVNREQIVDVIAFDLIFLRDNGMVVFLGLSFLVILTFLAGYFGRLIWDNFFK